MTKTILVVDDDVDFLEQMKVHLEAAGYEVVTAPNEARATEILKDLRPDVALVDLMMEHMDGGFSLCYHIKRKDPSVPVILITAVTHQTGLEFDASTDEERSWVKADAMLAKPVRFEQLEREIERLLKGTEIGHPESAGHG
jgi:CheY-like chemotaxis protein